MKLNDDLVMPVFRQSIIEGKNKILYKGAEIGNLILSFKDSSDKICVLRNKISSILWSLISDSGIKNHFVRQISIKEQVVNVVETFPFIMEIHSVTSAEFASRLGCSSGMNLKKGVTECKYKTSTKTYPLISRDHVLAFDWLTAQEWEEMMDSVKRANDILQGFFKALGMTIFSINMEFGKLYKDGGSFGISMCDELSPRTINFSIDDMLDATGDILYIECAKRFGILRED